MNNMRYLNELAHMYREVLCDTVVDLHNKISLLEERIKSLDEENERHKNRTFNYETEIDGLKEKVKEQEKIIKDYEEKLYQNNEDEKENNGP